MRDSATADTAVLQSISPADSGRDSTRRDSVVRDSAAGPRPDSSAAAPPAVILAADSAAGDSLYRRKGRCLTCHGTDAAGLPNLGANLRDAEWLHSDGSVAGIATTIAEGVARPRQAQIRMPAFATQLTTAEIDHLAAYLYALSHPSASTTSDAMARDTTSSSQRDSSPP